MATFTSTGYIDNISGYVVATHTGTNTWSAKTSWATMSWGANYTNPMVWYSDPIDLGSIRYFNMNIEAKSNGKITYDVITANTSSFSTVYDRAPKSLTITGSVSTSTTKKFGSYGIVFDGVDDYITTPDNSDFAFGTGNWTIEAWINLTNESPLGNVVYSKVGSTVLEFGVQSNFLYLNYGSHGYSGSNSPGLSTSTWYHIAASFDGTTVRLFRDGYCESASTTYGATNVTNTATVYIGDTASGNNQAGSDAGFSGYMDDVRVSNTCRYTGTVFTQAFTPPTATLVNDTATVLLITGERGIVDTPNIQSLVTTTTIKDGDRDISAFYGRYVMLGTRVEAGDRPTLYQVKFTPNTKRLDLLLDNVNTTSLTATTTATTSSRILDLGRPVSQVLAVFPQKSNGTADAGILPVVADKTVPSVAWVKATEGAQDYVYGGAGAAFIDPTTLTDPTIDVMVHVLPEQYMSNGQLSTR